MNKKLRIALDILLILVGFVLLGFGIKDAVTMYKGSQVTDNVKFFKSYSLVDRENIYKYATSKDTKKLSEDESGIIVFGKTTDAWFQVFVNPLNEIVKEYVDKIYYVELDKLDTEGLYYKDLEKSFGQIESFKVVIVKNGKIITSLNKEDIIDSEYDGAPIDYFDEERLDNLKELLEKISEL